MLPSILAYELRESTRRFLITAYEPSDLCLRARIAGRRSYVALDVELYHLERQSQNLIGDSVWRANLTTNKYSFAWQSTYNSQKEPHQGSFYNPRSAGHNYVARSRTISTI